MAALASKGPGGAVCRLDAGGIETLKAHLDQGPAVHGRSEDRRWTLARISTPIVELFRVRYSLRRVSLLLHRIGYYPQVPVHRAIERDEQAVETWHLERAVPRPGRSQLGR